MAGMGPGELWRATRAAAPLPAAARTPPPPAPCMQAPVVLAWGPAVPGTQPAEGPVLLAGPSTGAGAVTASGIRPVGSISTGTGADAGAGAMSSAGIDTGVDSGSGSLAPLPESRVWAAATRVPAAVEGAAGTTRARSAQRSESPGQRRSPTLPVQRRSPTPGGGRRAGGEATAARVAAPRARTPPGARVAAEAGAATARVGSKQAAESPTPGPARGKTAKQASDSPASAVSSSKQAAESTASRPSRGKASTKQAAESPASTATSSKQVPQRSSSRQPKIAPKSYKRLQEDLAETEAASEHYEAEERHGRREAAEFRQALLSVEDQSNEILATQDGLRLELQLLRSEAAEIWAAHEAPLQETEQQIHAVREATEALEHAARPQASAISALRAECRELASLGDSLRHQADAAEHGWREHMGRARGSEEAGEALAARHSEGQDLVKELRREAVLQQERAVRMRAEADAHRVEAQAAQRQMADHERWLRTEALQANREEAASNEALAFRARTLRGELQAGEQRLEVQSQETAALRQQALRGESRLCTLRGEDIASALRSMQAQCLLFSRDEVAPGVPAAGFAPPLVAPGIPVPGVAPAAATGSAVLRAG